MKIINKNINGYKVELIERRPATRIVYPAYSGEHIDENYGQEFDVVASGKFLGRVRREIPVCYTKQGRKYGKPSWIFYEEFMGDAADTTMNTSLTKCLKEQISRAEFYGHIGNFVKVSYKCPDYDYGNGSEMPDFGDYQEWK